MKIPVLIGAAAIALGSLLAAAPAAIQPAQGQAMQQMTPADRAANRVAAIDKAVTLTADQKTSLTALFTKAYTDSATARAGGDADAMQKSRDITTKAEADAKASLTPDQQAKYPAPGREGGRGGI